MTVPMWFGWEAVATIVVVLLVVGAGYLLVGAARAGASRRDEWQAFLDARSAGNRRPTVLDDGVAGTRQPSDAPSR